MSLQLQGLRTVVFKVGDLAKAKEWYTSILGIDPYFDEPFYVGFNVEGYELGLQPAPVVDDVPEPNVVTYWGVADIYESYVKLLGAGAVPYEEPADVGGDIIVASVKDPWGNAFGIIFNPNFSLP